MAVPQSRPYPKLQDIMLLVHRPAHPVAVNTLPDAACLVTQKHAGQFLAQKAGLLTTCPFTQMEIRQGTIHVPLVALPL